LRLCDVNWELGRFLVHASKTEHHEGKATRWVPIFPELRPYLEKAWHAAEPGQECFVTIGRDNSGAYYRTMLRKIIKRASLPPWPRLFQNLRSSRQTELEERFPSHVVCAWLGNSVRVARKHYLQVTDEHFKRAGQDGVQNRVQPEHEMVQNQVQQPDATERTNPTKNGRSGQFPRKQPLPPMGDTGFEPVTSAV